MSATIDLDRLAGAKLWLVAGAGDQPYLATALYALSAVSSERVDRMAADEQWRLYVNPTWLASAPVPVVAAELAHLTWHLLHDHAGRGRTMDVGTRHRRAWQDACDVPVGETLTHAGLPHALPDAHSLGLTPGRSAEEHFARLSRLAVDADPLPPHDATSDDRPDGCGSAVDGLARDYELPLAADVGAVGEGEAAEIRRRVAIEFRGHVSTRGTCPGEATRWVRAVLEPTVSWRQVLAASVRAATAWAAGHSDYTYRRPSRRQAAHPRVVLPATRRPVPSVVIVVDTSASVDDGLLAQALGEVDGAIAGLGVPGSHVRVLGCDTAVQAVQRVQHGRDLRLVGGGGTDLRTGIAAAERLRPRPEVLVVLTDGYTPWPERPPAAMAVVTGVLHRTGTHPPPTPGWSRRVLVTLGGT